MALPDLATAADLSARGIDTSNSALVAAMLAAASAAIREAAGSAISEQTSTVTLTAPEGPWLRLPAQPVTAVSAVEIDGADVTDWTLANGALWRSCGWRSCEPVLVTVTFTHGLAEVPADIVNLVCMFAAAGMAEASDGSRAGVVGERIDDYSVQYAQGAEASSSALEVPERTARMLRARFGGGTYVTGELS